MKLHNLKANWPAPSHIHALTTSRLGGFSNHPYNENNMGLHVGDNLSHVLKNRQQLQQRLALQHEPIWLQQTHSTDCIRVENTNNRQADAQVTSAKQYPLAIMTADCLPITLCDKEGKEIAAIHGGWRGLCFGIIENTLAQMLSPRQDILAWIGPGICGLCYEVGLEMRSSVLKRYPYSEAIFQPHKNLWLANLPALAELIFNQNGVFNVYHSNQCTFEHHNMYYSYRREANTGRMATLIWFNK
jgi:YfiH family protein